MISKDLKVNDTFTDEGREYRITKICDIGYESIAIDTEVKEEPKEETKLTCLYCGKECKNALGLASHEKACKENPTNKEA